LFRWEISQAKENKSKLVVSLVYYVCFCLITEKKKAVVSKKGRKKKLHIQKTSWILCAKKLGKTKKNAISTKNEVLTAKKWCLPAETTSSFSICCAIYTSL